jgi:hypothetical protein
VADSVTRNVILEAEWLRFVSRFSPEISFNSSLSSETYEGMASAMYNVKQCNDASTESIGLRTPHFHLCFSSSYFFNMHEEGFPAGRCLWHHWIAST